VVKVQNYRRGTVHLGLGQSPVRDHVPFLSIVTILRWGDALGHELDVGPITL